MHLFIANKNYSSWSLRAWLPMRQAGIAVHRACLRLDFGAGSTFKATLLALAPTGRVPLLVDDGFAVWDSLAIAEYLAERSRQAALARRSPPRARARSLCAEMHSGFGALRARCPMNIEASLPRSGCACKREWPDVAADLRRLDAMWREASGGAAAARSCSAGLASSMRSMRRSRAHPHLRPAGVGSATEAYIERIHALPAMQVWCAAARDEHDFIVDDEPYRTPALAGHKKSGPKSAFESGRRCRGDSALSEPAAASDEAHRAEAGEHHSVGLGLRNRGGRSTRP